MNRLFAANRSIVGLCVGAFITFLIVIQLPDHLIAIIGSVVVFVGGVALALGHDPLDRKIGYAVCATNAFILIMSFFASASEMTDPGRLVTVRAAAWIISLITLWGVGHLLLNKNEGASRALRFTAAVFFVLGVATSFIWPA